MVDFIACINAEATSLTTEQKVAMLDDFVAYFAYSEELGVTKKDFANEKIAIFIKNIVKSVRRKETEQTLAIEELDI